MYEQAEIDRKRAAIREYFVNKEKVDKMSPKQVIAIYIKLHNEGKIR